MNRRQTLAKVGATLLLPIAGCLSNSDETHATLQGIDLVNHREDSVMLERRIEREDTDEVVHSDEYDVPDGLDGFYECVWPDKPLTVMTRLVGDEWTSISTSEMDNCLFILVEITEDGTEMFHDHGECPVTSPNCHTDVEE